MWWVIRYKSVVTGLMVSEWFDEDSKQECHETVCELQKEGVAVRVFRRNSKNEDEDFDE
jgi:hypothetical protein